MTIPDYETMLQEFYTPLLTPGDFCIDVGAHLGRHTLPMARSVAPEGRVFAFEPIPHIAAELRAKLGNSPDRLASVELQECALSDLAGEADFIVVRDNPGYSGLRPRHYDGLVTTETIRVKVEKLDNLLRQMPKIRYIKIDCEGGELRVLRGGSALLRRDHPIVSFECGDASLECYDYDSGDVFDFWTAHEYQVQSIMGRVLGRSDFIDACKHQEFWDFIAIPTPER